jgi:acetylglutamate synthase
VRLRNQMVDNPMRFINVLERSPPQSMRKPIIFPFRDVMMRPVKQFQRFVIPPSPIHMLINRRMVIQILAIIDRRMLDLCNGLVDFADRTLLFPVHPVTWSHALQMSACVAQIGEGVQICGSSAKVKVAQTATTNTITAQRSTVFIVSPESLSAK